MSTISPLEDVVEKGTPHYEGKSFRRWSLIMRLKYGKAVTPYLEDAWKMIKGNIKNEAIKTDQPPDARRTALYPLHVVCSWFISTPPVNELDEPGYAFEAFKREVLCGWTSRATNFLGLLLIFCGTFLAVGFSFSKCGLAGYFLAYFAAFYLPTFWIQISHLNDFDSFEFVDWPIGTIAMITLGAVHCLLLLKMHFDKPDVDGSDFTTAECFFIEILPLFLGVECVMSYTRAKKNSKEGTSS